MVGILKSIRRHSHSRSSRVNREGHGASDESFESASVSPELKPRPKLTRSVPSKNAADYWPPAMASEPIQYLPHCSSIADDDDATEDIISPILSLTIRRQASMPAPERTTSLRPSSTDQASSSRSRPALQVHHRASDSVVPRVKKIQDATSGDLTPRSAIRLGATPSVEILAASVPASPILRPSRDSRTSPSDARRAELEKHVSYQVSIGGQTSIVRRYTPAGHRRGTNDLRFTSQPFIDMDSADSAFKAHRDGILARSTDTTKPLLARRERTKLATEIRTDAAKPSSAPTSPASPISSGSSAGLMPAARGSEFSRVYYADSTTNKSKSRLFGKRQ